jgi:3D (Asp-Asp-Asp) domain-containing protein
VVKKNCNIVVTRAFKVTVVADGKSNNVISTPISIREAIKLAGVTLGEKDIVKTLPVDKTVPGQEIEVIRVTESQVTEKTTIPCGTDRTSDDTLERGLTRTLSAGKDGLAMQTIRVIYHNGQEVKREVIKSETLVEPKNRLVAMGTITSVSRGSHTINFKEAKYMETSAYTYTGYRTATGRTPQVGTVAVDPSVIPLGSNLYIEGYGYAQAADTGGSIKGNRVDVFMEDRTQCFNWGRRTVKVYIMN